VNTYKRHRFPSDIISYAVWLYYRFNLSHRDIEDLLAERGITVSREAIRLWCIKFGAIYTRRLKRKHRGYGDTFYIDEVFVKIKRGMRKFKSVRQAQRFLGTHAAVSNLFNLGRHLVRAQHYRNLRTSAFAEWGRAVA
jgi:transposase-like protein